MEKLILFTDGSVNTRSKIGYGAYLAIRDSDLTSPSFEQSVKTRRFENTSSTKLELETLLWALEETRSLAGEILVCTDSQNIIGLPGRRQRFEKKDYRSKNGKLLGNHDLYRKFFEVTDRLNCKFEKIKGHSPAKQKGDIDKLFALVDKASRNALRSTES